MSFLRHAAFGGVSVLGRLTSPWTACAKPWATRLTGVFIFLTAAMLLGQPAPPLAGRPSATARRLDVFVEIRTGDSWAPVDPATVFESGAQLRFRVRANFAGYLYLTNQGTSGETTLIFPRADTGTANRLEAGKEYLVPSNAGAMQVTGPPGYEILYWTISPTSFSPAQSEVQFSSVRPPSGYVPLPPPPAAGTKLHTLIPRCDDGILRARGNCISRPQPTGKPAAPAFGLKSRDLVFVQDVRPAAILQANGQGGPVTFELRIAHQ